MSNAFTKFNGPAFLQALVNGLEGNASLTKEQVKAAFAAQDSGYSDAQLNTLLTTQLANGKIGKTLDGTGYVTAANGYSTAERKGYKAANKPAVTPRAKKERVAGEKAPAAVKHTVEDFLSYMRQQLGAPLAKWDGTTQRYPLVLIKGQVPEPAGVIERFTGLYGKEPTAWYNVDDKQVGLL